MWKNSKIRIYIIVFLISFVTNVNSQTNDDFNKKFLSKSYYDLIIPDNIKIDILGKNYINYLKQIKNVGQKKNLNSNIVNFEKKKWVKARIITDKYNNTSLPIRLILHGDFNDHISLPYSSLRVKMKKNYFHQLKDFILFKPKTRRYEGEIFGTLFLNKIGILAPYTKYILLTINENPPENYIFQEKISKYFIERNGLREEPILEYDEKNKWNKYLLNFEDTPKVNFYKLENSDYLSNRDNINKVLHATTIKQLNFNNNFANNLFETSMLLMGGCHGLAEHNRKYYYDSLNNTFLPIYYDGMLFYDQNNDLCKTIRKESKLEISNDVIIYLKKKIIDPTFKNELKKEFLESTTIKEPEKFNFYWEYITSYLEKLENLVSMDERITEILNKEIFLSEKIKSLKLPYPTIFFYNDIEQNKFKLCYDWQELNEKIFLINGKKKFFKKDYQGCHIINEKKLINLLENKISYKTNLSDELEIFPIMVGNVIKDKISINNSDIKIKEIYINTNKKLNIFNLENNSILFLNIAEQITLDKLIINSSPNNNSSVILKSRNTVIKNLEFNQNNNSKSLLNKSAQYKNITGCLNILDSKLVIDQIIINGSNCEDGLNIVRSDVLIEKIDVFNTISDGVDFDYSKIEVKTSNFLNIKGDCIDLSFGEYEFKNAIVNKCGDKGVSVGENSKAYFDNLIVNNSNIGLASKDNSKAYIINATINNVEYCLSAYNKKNEFYAGYINYTNVNCKNYNVLFDVDQKSIIYKNTSIKKLFNNE